MKANKGAGGIDGETIESYDANRQENITTLLNKLKTKTYQVQPGKELYIPKKNGKKCPLGIPTIEDHIDNRVYSMSCRINPRILDNYTLILSFSQFFIY